MTNALQKLALSIPFAFALACGGSPASRGDPATSSLFEGLWTDASGQQTTQCSTGVSYTAGGATVAVVASGPSQIVTEANGCSLLWDVIGGIATLAGSQTCSCDEGCTVATFTSATADLEGNTIVGTAQGYATINGAQCSFEQSYSWAR